MKKLIFLIVLLFVPSVAVSQVINTANVIDTVVVPSAVQTLSAGTTVADNAGTIQMVGNGGAVTLTGTPTISAGVDGQRLLIRGTHDTNTVTLQDVANLGTSALWLGGTDFTMTQGDRLLLEYSGTLSAWVEISRTDN